ncbi:glycosyltransferase [Paraconexibacter antarcticus]|uniref:Glycosyltransferase n=1 Tax=Paraconexibacter antarcticus TaxID=2949664 RepID=A0ABY5DWY7_9ACTN|nr:glycosyltransferase [Paraconexibacter antarcticus]UTI65064.1 glycosyltransferase [Paraconexibacter antarcticus]
MALSTLQGDRPLEVTDGTTVVVIPLYGQHELFAQCLSSVLEHTPVDVPILVADDASPDEASRWWVAELEAGGHLRHAVYWSRAEINAGFVGNCNRAFALCGRGDVLLLNSDCVVADGWVEGLRAAVASDGSIATASSLTNHGSIVSVPVRNTPAEALPQHTTLDVAARAVRENARRLYPRLPTAIGHCVLVRRAAIDLVGGFDEAFAPGYGEEVDFSQRCIASGMQHVLADDVLVLHQGGGTFQAAGSATRDALQLAHEKLIRQRYPAYRIAVEEAESEAASPLARALAIAGEAILGPRVTVDVRCLGPYLTGTQVHALELVHALWRTGQAQVRLLLPDGLGTYAQPVIEAMAGVETIRERDIVPTTRRDPLVHRPFQVSSLRDLSLLELLGERLVVTHQDLISYRNPEYFDHPRQWRQFRDLTAETLATAATTIFFTEHAAADALAENLVPAGRVRVAHLGVDHQLEGLQVDARIPAFADRVTDRPFLLCLGTNFKHKNRLFALRLLRTLREDHGWDGRLVFCGPHVVRGSSAGLEAEYLASRPDLREVTVDVAAVDESEKRWLLGRAAAVVYPTTYEGFGLVPFEAAGANVPCLFAAVSALAEVLPPALSTLVPWDPAQSAARVRPLLDAGAVRDAHVDGLRAAAATLTWDRTASAVLEAYHDTLALPARDLARVTEQHIPDARYWALRHQIGGTGMSLVGPDRLLPESTQRALAALLRRGATRGPLLTVLGALARLGGGSPPDRPSLPPAKDDDGDGDDDERHDAIEDAEGEAQVGRPDPRARRRAREDG